MTTFYFSIDCDNADYSLNQNADIIAIEADTLEQAKALASIRYFDKDSEFFPTDWVECQYGDCWIKTRQEPNESTVFDCFTIDDLSVLYPGTHPGGEVYWITPLYDVFLPVD